MANESGTADHSRTTYDIRLEKALADPDNAACGVRLFGQHVAEFIGLDRPWTAYGRLAIQNFRAPHPGAVYFIGGDTGRIKIGMSVCPLERLAAFQLGSPIDLRIMALARGYFDVEDEYHSRFAEHRVRGEWFERHPDILAEIARLSTGPAHIKEVW